MDMVYEVRRQFREIPGMEGTGKPEYAKCVDISTKATKRNDVAWILTIGFLSQWYFLGNWFMGTTIN
jgi:K(+)-stimulated pyrophosphate-energized sodium pump